MNIVNSVCYGADEVVGAFVRSRLRDRSAPDFDLPYGPDPQGNIVRLYAALGVTNKDGVLIGGVVFHNLYFAKGKPVCIEASIASAHPGWGRRSVLRQVFKYPFVQLGCTTLIARIRRSNKRSRDIVKRLGFVEVGKLSRAFDGTEDLFIYEMTADKCPWLKG